MLLHRLPRLAAPAFLLLAACGGADGPAPASTHGVRPVEGMLAAGENGLGFTPCGGVPRPLQDATPGEALTGLVGHLAAARFQARLAIAGDLDPPAGDEDFARDGTGAVPPPPGRGAPSAPAAPQPAEGTPLSAVGVYSLVPGEAGCAAWPDGLLWRLHGIGRGWSAQVTAGEIAFRDVNQAVPERIAAGPPDTGAGDWRWQAPDMALVIETRPCLDPRRGYFAHSAVLTRGADTHKACAEMR